eukprot:4667118-Alexandrium_andersonii.AAC.1
MGVESNLSSNAGGRRRRLPPSLACPPVSSQRACVRPGRVLLGCVWYRQPPAAVGKNDFGVEGRTTTHGPGLTSSMAHW